MWWCWHNQVGFQMQNGRVLLVSPATCYMGTIWAFELTGKFALQASRIQASVWGRGQWGLIAWNNSLCLFEHFSDFRESRRSVDMQVLAMRRSMIQEGDHWENGRVKKGWQTETRTVGTKLVLDDGCWAACCVTQHNSCLVTLPGHTAWSHCLLKHCQVVGLQSLSYVGYKLE